VQRLVREALLVAGLDAVGRPPLAATRRGLGVVLTVPRPRHREPGVEDAARRKRSLDRVVDDRQWRDRGEVRWTQLRDEQLRDTGIRQADHPDVVVRDPRLRGDRLDRHSSVDRMARSVERGRHPVPRTWMPTVAYPSPCEISVLGRGDVGPRARPEH
jgi:hypothetical protein